MCRTRPCSFISRNAFNAGILPSSFPLSAVQKAKINIWGIQIFQGFCERCSMPRPPCRHMFCWSQRFFFTRLQFQTRRNRRLAAIAVIRVPENTLCSLAASERILPLKDGTNWFRCSVPKAIFDTRCWPLLSLSPREIGSYYSAPPFFFLLWNIDSITVVRHDCSVLVNKLPRTQVCLTRPFICAP